MRTGMLALAVGLLALRFLPELPPGGWLFAGAVFGLMCLPFRSYPLAFFLFGLCWACLSAQSALDARLAPELDGRTLWLEGQVSGLPERDDGVVRFQLEDATARRAQLPQRLRLSWYGGPPLHAGERWRLAVTLKRGRGLVNPQAFDYEAWLLAQRIGATGTVKRGERLSAAVGPAAWRDALRQRLLAVDAFDRQGAIAALVLGDDSGLSRADWRLLQDTGTVHLMVISGQHVALLAALVYALVAGLARLGLWPRVLPWLPSACLLAFSAALGYGVLAGFEVPVRRACVMIAMVLLWRLRFRHLGVWLPWLLSLNVVLLAEPLASLQAGFWLSFAAVAVLAWVFAGRLGAWSWWRSWGRAQWTMAIGLLPMLLALGLPVSASGPLANLIAVPWVSFISVPLALLGTLALPLFGLGDGLLWLAGGSLELLFRLLAGIAAWLPAWSAPALPWWAVVLGALGAALLLAPSGVPLRGLGLALLLPMLCPPTPTPPVSRVAVTVLDVGQGLSVLLRTRNHAMLYDAGPRYGEFDIGERVVLPSLRALGVSRLDLMLISHADSDHAGGALAVQHGLAVGRVLSGEASALAPELQAAPCVDDAQWSWDGVRFTTWRWREAPEGNPASCVLLVEANGERLLLTGDIDAAAERALLNAKRAVQADWLLAPHHGSRSSSSAVFLKTVRPRAVLVSRGNHNAFGHPHPQVLARYRALGVAIHDSVEEGALQLELGAHGGIHGLRSEPRFWREK
ncbi:DNA internalization-related competence protein ComEC/Rec2 [Pseudomonas sp. UL073]|uniref:DNA internalization-related competence protein ComEC/Rec2 n=1 Tax=Zestomonas insulae TaxID=2809017 RepID=A0ABS2IGA1_9GAMM|nr:DNA internalization-related competence protein ComEC/Rec2 [Pseudomonas insulae]MBM7060982.1 DNA internalization-related competence protein ComEC/Rec2 [Pseudomonas insulae]